MDNLLAELKAILVTTPLRWKNLCENFSEELLRRQPLPDEWSALECLQHLVEVEQHVFPSRVRAILAGNDFPAFEASTDYASQIKDISPMDLAEKFAAIRSESLKVLDEVSPSDFERTALHSRLGEISLSHLLHEWGTHDLNHLVQAEQAMMQPFIAGCGAFDFYFQKHVARAGD